MARGQVVVVETSVGTVGAANGGRLLQIARQSLIAFVTDLAPYNPHLEALPEPLRQPASSFVTLHSAERLRGCIGSTTFAYPLAEDVARNAAAAGHDPRFPRVTVAELPEIRLEVSVLQMPQPLVYRDLGELTARLRPHVDGVILNWRERRALLLPQVWERLSEPEGFLRALCHKAHIPSEELMRVPPTILVFTFEAESFKEDGYDDTEHWE